MVGLHIGFLQEGGKFLCEKFFYPLYPKYAFYAEVSAIHYKTILIFVQFQSESYVSYVFTIKAVDYLGGGETQAGGSQCIRGVYWDPP